MQFTSFAHLVNRTAPLLFLGGLCAGSQAQYPTINLSPIATFLSGEGNSVTGTTQVGNATSNLILLRHASLWSSTSASYVDLQDPATFPYTNIQNSYAAGCSTGSQVGWGFNTTKNKNEAFLWNGTAASVVQLHPPTALQFLDSYAEAVSGGTQVGHGQKTNLENHALLWSGNSGSAVDLNPNFFSGSEAYGTSGPAKQIGYGVSKTLTGGADHAILWAGSNMAYTDLHPSGYTRSYGLAVSGTSQVGYATAGNDHAILWKDGGAPAVDLHPAGYTNSVATAVNGAFQVGWASGGTGGPGGHAVAWSGSASSVIDIHDIN